MLRDVLLLAGAATTAVAAALAVPGPLGAPHAGLAAAVVLAAAVLIIRFTGGHIRLCTAAIVLALAALLTGLARMLLLTSAVTLLTITLLVTVLAIKMAPSVARQAARIRLPVFPSASGRWIWDTRPDLPATVVVAAGKDPELDGPESVRDVALATDRVHSYLSGLLAGLCVLLVIAATGLCDPHTHQRWLPLIIAGITAAWAVLHGRTYTDRWQATMLAAAGVTVVAAVCVRYAVELWTAPVMLVCCAITVAVPTVGLVAAAVVPNNFYTPVFKQLVEWTEYVLLLAMWPLGFWLIDVFAAIRYRMNTTSVLRASASIGAVCALVGLSALWGTPTAAAIDPPTVDPGAVPPDGPPAPAEEMRQGAYCTRVATLPDTDYRVQPKFMDMLNLPEAWQFGRGAGVKVAVIDTGVSPHPRLPNLVGGGDYVMPGDGLSDCDAHGTWVASLIAARPADGKTPLPAPREARRPDTVPTTEAPPPPPPPPAPTTVIVQVPPPAPPPPPPPDARPRRGIQVRPARRSCGSPPTSA